MEQQPVFSGLFSSTPRWAMKHNARYSIGDMSRICNISRKALRYYDKIGLISSQRQDFNNYRYYTSDSLLVVPVIKYYKQMGFTLEEMSAFIEGESPNIHKAIKTSFLAKIEELEQEQAAIARKLRAVKDWYNMVVEAQMVIDSDIREVAVRYVEPDVYIYQEQLFANGLKAAIINIDWTNYLEKINNEITGPVMLSFSSHLDRMEEKEQKFRIFQKPLLPTGNAPVMRFGGSMLATCYHVGPHETLPETYKKIIKWAKANNYDLGERCFERYVADYWLTGNTGQFVTDVMLEVSRKAPARAGN
jgi:DNA-binding transcriptional MerR regulator